MQRVMRLSSEGLSCSQILMTMALEDRGCSSPELIQAMDGLAMGCGMGQASCGVLTGAACVLGLYAGADGPNRGPSPDLKPMLAQLHQWFVVAAEMPRGELSCQAVMGTEPSPMSMYKCAELVAKAYVKTTELLAAYGL